jgi:maltose O-acetyltransferase
MLAGELYHATDPELQADLAQAQRKLRALNAIANEDVDSRRAALTDLLAHFGERTEIRSPFFCDYGYNIRIGARGFINYGAVLLDVNLIEIGDDAQIGPNVQILTAYHPVDPDVRRTGLETAKPIHIGDNVWLGAGAILLPGITIGDNSVIGAGSVVTRDVPAGVIAFGNPCRVIRKCTDARDSLKSA